MVAGALLVAIFTIVNVRADPGTEVALKFRVAVKDTFSNETYRESFIHLPDFIDATKVSSNLEYLSSLSFCADLMPNFLLRQTLVSIGHQFIVTLLNLPLGLIRVNFDTIAYLIHVDMVILPKQWHRMCFVFRASQQLDVVFDGILLDNDIRIMKPLNLSIAEMNAAGLTLGYHNPDKYAFKMIRKNKFHGFIYGVYLWSKELSVQDMIDITGKKCIDQKKTLAECDYAAWVGIKKNGSDDQYIDVNTNEAVTFLKFPEGHPNGREFENCLVLNNASDHSLGYHDEYCYGSRCSLCELDLDYTRVTIRGEIDLPDNANIVIDRDFTCDNSSGRGLVNYIGTLDTLVYWSSQDSVWKMRVLFRKNSNDLGHTLNDNHPLGLTTWNISNHKVDLKMTTCGYGKFTCHKYGACIDIGLRCDGKYDCLEGDQSDEEACQLVSINADSYKKEQAPRGENDEPTMIRIKLRVDKIPNVNELGQTITVKIKLSMKWYDDRLTFNNLHPDREFNKIDANSMFKIWTPTLAILDAQGLATTLADKAAVMTVDKKSRHKTNPLTDVHENRMYYGKDNVLVLERFYDLTIHCSFDLSMFPFDMQKCPIGMVVPGYLEPHINITLHKVYARHEDIDLNQYDFIGFTTGNETINSPKIFQVHMKLKRIFIYHLAATFMPTLCLVLISELTIYIDEKHFEATIMVALTTMLVMYTLFQSVGDSLPHTSYLKMIDIWLLTGLIVPFFIILILIVMDAIKENEDNMSAAESKGSFRARKKKKSKMIRWVKLMVPVLTLVFVLIYCVIAARQYNKLV